MRIFVRDVVVTSDIFNVINLNDIWWAFKCVVIFDLVKVNFFGNIHTLELVLLFVVTIWQGSGSSLYFDNEKNWLTVNYLFSGRLFLDLINKCFWWKNYGFELLFFIKKFFVDKITHIIIKTGNKKLGCYKLWMNDNTFII